MEFEKVIMARRSIRKYKSDAVPEEKLQKLYNALRLAPTGVNNQPFKFIFVKDPDMRRQVAERAGGQEFVGQAPVIMVACCEKGSEFDTAIAVDHMVLAACNEGLGTCWVGWFEKDKIRKLLGIPANLDIPIIVPIGYADETPDPRPRKSIEQLICTDRY